MKTKYFIFGFCIALILLSISSVFAVSTLSEPSVCCEKTKAGGYCINTKEENCAAGFKKSSTSCESTSYCKKGTCYDSLEGMCTENTPQIICEKEGGTWDERELSELPQCRLGCCIIGDQAAFVSLVRAKRLSTLYGIEIDYRTEINNELECIALAQSQDIGACVYDKDFEKTCKFTTRKDCTEGKFYKDYLCSAEELNTECARQVSTNCYQGKVYWYDSCGNRENIYSSDMSLSWNNGRIVKPEEICQKNDGSNINCGNCDYLKGSRCAVYDKGILNIGKPMFGDYYCRKNTCVDENGKERKNGEAWCVYDGDVGKGKDSVGSRHFRELCIDGEVHIEPCADFRNYICQESIVETSEGDYSNAVCRVNRWRECTQQNEKDECEDIEKRDCRWVEGISILGDVCLPEYAPGFDFWAEEGDSNEICSQGSVECIIQFEKKVVGSKKCVENCECEDESWAIQMNQYCTGLGDCGGYVNYIKEYSEDGFEWTIDGKKQEVSKVFEGKFLGKIIGIFS